MGGSGEGRRGGQASCSQNHAPHDITNREGGSGEGEWVGRWDDFGPFCLISALSGYFPAPNSPGRAPLDALLDPSSTTHEVTLLRPQSLVYEGRGDLTACGMDRIRI